MNNIYLTFDVNNELTHITFFFDNNEKSTVSADKLSDDVKNVYIADNKKQQTLARYDRHLNLVSYDDPNFVETDLTYDNKQRFNTHKYFDVALKKLTSDQQRLIHEIYYRNTTVTELAEQLNVTKSAISHRLSRAKTALKNHLVHLDTADNFALAA